MTKRLIDIDDEVLETARVALGTSTYKDTVNQALARVADASRRDGLQTGAALKAFAAATTDLADDEVMSEAWR